MTVSVGGANLSIIGDLQLAHPLTVNGPSRLHYDRVVAFEWPSILSGTEPKARMRDKGKRWA